MISASDAACAFYNQVNARFTREELVHLMYFFHGHGVALVSFTGLLRYSYSGILGLIVR